MSDVTDGIGGVIEGALAGRAVEPHQGDASTGVGNPITCSNCGATVSATYCPQCGQKRHVHRTLSAIGHDLIHGVLHLDGKLWRTLPLLTLKPGRLTRRYIDGERAKFVSPMAMFLFSVFAMFAVFQMVGLTTPTDFDPAADVSETAGQLKTNAETERDELQRQLEALAPGDPRRAELQQGLIVIDGGLNRLGQAETINLGNDTEMDFGATGIDWIDRGIIKKWQQNPGLMLYKLQANGYKFSWLLIPLSIPFVWLTFAWRRRFKAYDHAVFVTYSLSFMSLLFITMSLIGASPLGPGWAFTIFATVAPLHIYKQLKYTYELSRFSALWRFFVLSICINIILLLFLQALLVLGAF